MRLKAIIQEDFTNYKHPSLFLVSAVCDWKCCKEQNLDVSICQNSSLAQFATSNISNQTIYNYFINNPITKAVVIGGLEPIKQIDELVELIDLFRSQKGNCPFVIYTGYNKEEITQELDRLKPYGNIVMKYGRYVPNHLPHFDPILGVELASDNQYGEVLC